MKNINTIQSKIKNYKVFFWQNEEYQNNENTALLKAITHFRAMKI